MLQIRTSLCSNAPEYTRLGHFFQSQALSAGGSAAWSSLEPVVILLEVVTTWMSYACNGEGLCRGERNVGEEELP